MSNRIAQPSCLAVYQEWRWSLDPSTACWWMTFFVERNRDLLSCGDRWSPFAWGWCGGTRRQHLKLHNYSLFNHGVKNHYLVNNLRNKSWRHMFLGTEPTPNRTHQSQWWAATCSIESHLDHTPQSKHGWWFFLSGLSKHHHEYQFACRGPAIINKKWRVQFLPLAVMS